MKRIITDYENNGDLFWLALTEYDVIHMAPIGEEARAATARLSESGCDSVLVSDEVAREMVEFFATLPGWHDGPEYAPHPVLVQDA